MPQEVTHQELSPQDSTFMFIHALQEQLAKSDFVSGINKSRDLPAPASSSSQPSQNSSARYPASSSTQTNSKRLPPSVSSSSSGSRPSGIAKWTDPDAPGARITRLKPPKQTK
ncbi:hypothetical protein A1O7_04519 [Cladophialophora yegresii CBS 114405]|uniref:Uncharacterized protein n=1 Tax=Cladophialophora yegresii CBS 114405 TaxID=1182544 RepID=W9VX37_9EURO|nr:uncharacterized protein A1O7_04519 [Cladophialophora yegresii CBS 114405]EXJ60367.1 hypothetical protein A1O7_04519 [Cladophialophora yegresii CBS 114405]